MNFYIIVMKKAKGAAAFRSRIHVFLFCTKCDSPLKDLKECQLIGLVKVIEHMILPEYFYNALSKLSSYS